MSKLEFKVEIPAEEKERRQKEQQMREQREARKQQRQSKLAALADKKAKGKLALDDVDAKLDVIIEMLEDLMPPK